MMAKVSASEKGFVMVSVWEQEMEHGKVQKWGWKMELRMGRGLDQLLALE
jgi:hypothetical protein